MAEAPSGPVFVVGDVHGCLDRLAALLTTAGLIDDRLGWNGADATLWFIGDLLDRGPDGADVVDLAIRLEDEARSAGGRVATLLGNHEVMLVSAVRLGTTSVDGATVSFLECWLRNGGRPSDLARLNEGHLTWMSTLPAMALERTTLLLHADTARYLDYGASIGEVNDSIREIMAGSDPIAWARLLDDLCDRHAFIEDEALPLVFLERFGGSRIVHGHTPIAAATGVSPRAVRGPLVYARGTCVNIDGALYAGGDGFLYEITPERPDGER